MPSLPKRHIAASYLPSRYFQGYAFCKLATDPLYEAVCREFSAQDAEPLLDLGCGLGLLLHCLRATGNPIRYVGLDYDATKIASARAAAARGGIVDAEFIAHDLAQPLPAHSGHVALLDTVQYLEPAARERVLQEAASRLSPGGKLVMRVALDDRSWRAAIARHADRMGHALRWMRSAFVSQPTRDELQRTLDGLGLQARFSPLWGYTPFNNYLVVAARD
jgi:SAM-dependent methyltransferase